MHTGDLPAIQSFERTRLVDEVTAHLRDLILSGTLAPGTQLLQIELSEKLGVSRTPLRESFRILERDGLVRISNGNRTVEVVSFAPETLKEMYEVREVIDGLAARLAAENGLANEQDKEVRDALRTMDDSVSPYKHDAYVTAHAVFHVAIVQGCGNKRLAAQLPMVRMTASSMRFAISETEAETRTGLLHKSSEEHSAIYEAIVKGDQRGAEKAARRHIASSRRSWLLGRAAESLSNGQTIGG